MWRTSLSDSLVVSKRFTAAVATNGLASVHGVVLRVVVGLAGWRWGPTAKRQVELLYWQRQCFAHVRAADAPAWEDDRAKAAALLSANADYVAASAQAGAGAAIHLPRRLREFERLGGLPASSRSEPILFLHERYTPGGRRRLVVVRANGEWQLSATVYAPASGEPLS